MKTRAAILWDKNQDWSVEEIDLDPPQAGEVLAAVENGPLWATRFHPETSGEAGAGVLRNWIAQLG